MISGSKHIVIVGGGTAGSVLAARLTEAHELRVTLLEAGADDDTYGDAILQPSRAAGSWNGLPPMRSVPMAYGARSIDGLQARILGGTSALNGMATLRGLPEDYDGWVDRGLDGWGWDDVLDTFVAAETDRDFADSPIHGSSGPLPVRRWTRDELAPAARAFHDAMVASGERVVTDVNDPDQLPGVGVFPVTIDDDGRRVSTSRAYLPADVRSREHLTVRTGAEVDRLLLDGDRVVGVALSNGDEILADEVVVAAGALWTPWLLMRRGVGRRDPPK